MTTATFPVFDVETTLTSPFSNSPQIVRLVHNFGSYFDPTTNLTAFFNDYWNIDTAAGVGLDTWGRILGVSRVLPVPGNSTVFGFDNADIPSDWQPWSQAPFFSGSIATGSFRLNDDAFRTLLLAKALSNICTTTIPSLNALITNLFPGRGRCYVLDLGGMAMRYVFEFALSSIEFAILAFSGVLPHPAGVDVTVVVIPPENFLGFKEAAPGAKPYGFGVFYTPGAATS